MSSTVSEFSSCDSSVSHTTDFSSDVKTNIEQKNSIQSRPLPLIRTYRGETYMTSLKRHMFYFDMIMTQGDSTKYDYHTDNSEISELDNLLSKYYKHQEQYDYYYNKHNNDQLWSRGVWNIGDVWKSCK